jgi:HPt (histidine-containing phosphotransfer) domain-containing protein
MSAPLLDAARVASWRSLYDGDDAEALTAVLDRFLATLGRHVESVRAASGGDDAEVLRRAAHGLRGSAGMVGAPALADAAAAVEDAAATGAFDRATLATIGGLWERTAPALRAEVGAGPADGAP